MHLDEEYAHLYGKHIDDMSVPGYITGQQTDVQYGDKNIDDIAVPFDDSQNNQSDRDITDD